jgi:hypothetical protein
MKLPSFKSIKKTDYEAEYQKLVETLSVSLNNGIQVLYDSLNHRTSLRDNIACTIKDIEVEVNTFGIPKDTLIIKTELTTKVEGCQIIYALNKTVAGNYVQTSGGPFISYEAIQNGISVNHIAGLVANNKYLLRVVIYQQ